MLMARMLSAVGRLTYAQTVLQDHPVAWWKLNEASGTVAADSSGNGYNGTYEGGFTLAALVNPSGVGGKGVKFDGSTGYVLTPLPTTAIASVTLEAWMNFDGLSSASGPFLQLGSAAVSGYGVGVGSGSAYTVAGTTLMGLYSTKTWNSSGALIPTSGWHICHMVITATGTSIFYIDGAQVGTNSNSSVLAPSGNGYIAQAYGGGTGSNFFGGALSNVAIYNTVLSAARIQAHYNAGIA